VPILRDIPIRVDLDELVQAHLPARLSARPPAPQVVEAARVALERSPSLISPALIYDFFPVEAVTDGVVYLPSGMSLTIGRNAVLLEPAEELLVGVLTIGPALDAAVSICFRSGEELIGLMLDSAGVIALGRVGEKGFEIAQQRAEALGGGVSASFAPGSVPGWSITRQWELCALLPIEEIGVELSESGLLVPLKSVSFAVGIGAGYQEHEVGSLCHLCALQDTCWRRRG